MGAYRRALSTYDVKLAAVPTLSQALDEPSAYEVVEPGSVLNVARQPRNLRASDKLDQHHQERSAAGGVVP